jgi:hypothetical protein
MGDDDRNEGPVGGECPGHEWEFAAAVPTAPTRMGVRGLNLVERCKWCEVPRYRPSELES